MKNYSFLSYSRFIFILCLSISLLTSCSKDIEPSPDQFDEQIEKRCANLCENLVYSYTQTFTDTCCLITLSAHFVNGCPSQPIVRYNGVQIFPSAMIGPDYVYLIEKCGPGLIEIYGDEEEACEQLDVDCGDCCAETQLTYNLLSKVKKCCTYEVSAINDSDCNMFLFGLDSGTVSIPPHTSTNQIIEICDDSKIIELGRSSSDICKSEEITCGCTAIVPNIVSATSSPESSCCTYQITLSNSDNCTAFVFDDNGNVLATIPPMTSIIFTIDVCPSDGFGITLSFGCSINNICNTLPLTLLCEEGD